MPPPADLWTHAQAVARALVVRVSFC